MHLYCCSFGQVSQGYGGMPAILLFGNHDDDCMFLCIIGYLSFPVPVLSFKLKNDWLLCEKEGLGREQETNICNFSLSLHLYLTFLLDWTNSHERALISSSYIVITQPGWPILPLLSFYVVFHKISLFRMPKKWCCKTIPWDAMHWQSIL